MTLGLAFWIIMLIWFAFGLWWNWPNHGVVGSNFILLLLFTILGWKVFGAPIHG